MVPGREEKALPISQAHAGQDKKTTSPKENPIKTPEGGLVVICTPWKDSVRVEITQESHVKLPHVDLLAQFLGCTQQFQFVKHLAERR